MLHIYPSNFLCFRPSGSRVQMMLDDVSEAMRNSSIPTVPPPCEWQERPDPSSTGIRYMLTPHGKSIRCSWPLPPSAEKAVDNDKGSSEGCKKVRFTYVGHRQRSGLWFTLCMDHQTVVGYHVMPHGEGRRDAFFPIYRFLETPPEAIFGDYVCGIEETSVNYLPEYFCKSEFFHDVMHGCSHSCSERFCSRRLSAYAVINTSLMEQVMYSSRPHILTCLIFLYLSFGIFS